MVGGGGGYQINGQQLQLQLDQLAGAMTDMMMDDDEMEVNDLTFNSHLSRGGGRGQQICTFSMLPAKEMSACHKL